MAGAIRASRDMVPYFSRMVSSPSTVPGTLPNPRAGSWCGTALGLPADTFDGKNQAENGKTSKTMTLLHQPLSRSSASRILAACIDHIMHPCPDGNGRG